MELFRVKVKATGEEVVVRKKETENSVFMTADDRVFKKDELEFPEDSRGCNASPSVPNTTGPEPVDFLAHALDVQRKDFWRIQRVEIVKILLRREETERIVEISDVVSVADEIIQKLKTFED